MQVAQELVLFLRRPGGQAQFSSVLTEQAKVSDQAFRDLPSWAVAHLTGDLSVRALAAVCAMSERTLARRFAGEFGMTAAAWVQSLRIAAVQQHLQTGELSLKQIATQTGFQDEGSLRRAFRGRLGITPTEYRERFQNTSVR